MEGAWLRAFDFEKWDYWASDADLGWGAWSVETGWTQTWITTVFALRAGKTSLWDVTGGAPGATSEQLRQEILGWLPFFFPDE